MRIVTILTIIFGITAGIACAEIYKWRDKNGAIHFSDTPMTKQKFKEYTPGNINITESKAQDINPPQQGSKVNPVKQELNSKEKVLSKKEREEKLNKDIEKMLEYEKHRPKSRQERIQERKERTRHIEEMNRRAGIFY